MTLTPWPWSQCAHPPPQVVPPWQEPYPPGSLLVWAPPPPPQQVQPLLAQLQASWQASQAPRGSVRNAVKNMTHKRHPILWPWTRTRHSISYLWTGSIGSIVPLEMKHLSWNDYNYIYIYMYIYIWVRSQNCGCLVTWFCYQMIAKPGNKTATVSWPDPYINHWWP